MRNTKRYSFNGVEYNSISQAAQALGLSTSMLSHRMRQGMSFEQAVTAPKNYHARRDCVFGNMMTVRDASNKYSIPDRRIYYQMNERNMTLQDAIQTILRNRATCKKCARGEQVLKKIDTTSLEGVALPLHDHLFSNAPHGATHYQLVSETEATFEGDELAYSVRKLDDRYVLECRSKQDGHLWMRRVYPIEKSTEECL